MKARPQWVPETSRERVGVALNIGSALFMFAVLAISFRTFPPTLAMMYGLSITFVLAGVAGGYARLKYPVPARKRPVISLARLKESGLGWRSPLAWLAIGGVVVWLAGFVYAARADVRESERRSALQAQLASENEAGKKTLQDIQDWIRGHPLPTPEDSRKLSALIGASSSHTGNLVRLGTALVTPAKRVLVWPAIVALGFPAAWLCLALWARQLQLWRRENGRCVRCGYDLRSSPERCPECGDRVP